MSVRLNFLQNLESSVPRMIAQSGPKYIRYVSFLLPGRRLGGFGFVGFLDSLGVCFSHSAKFLTAEIQLFKCFDCFHAKNGASTKHCAFKIL